ncbi:MAG: hypothetical protein NT178_11250 [Proteobacteria bacterium]|nr:hypothetical protein [Pseudomonadota bacterium]
MKIKFPVDPDGFTSYMHPETHQIVQVAAVGEVMKNNSYPPAIRMLGNWRFFQGRGSCAAYGLCYGKKTKGVKRSGTNQQTLRIIDSHNEVYLHASQLKPHIVYPADETLISIDPEIPDELQRVPFRFQPSTRQYEWVLNDKKTGVFSPLFLWKPARGRYELSIVDKQNYVLDSVGFVVR